MLERIRPPIGGDPPLYVVRSTGVIPGPRPQDPDARRTVAQLAQWQAGTMDPSAAWVSLTGLHKNGSAGTISGQDQCGVNPAVPGVAVPQYPGYSANGGFEPEGDPSVEEWTSIMELLDEVGVNWKGIADQSAITPDVVIPDDPWPSFNDPSYWPIIHVTGDLRLRSSGRGILIVTGGSLTMSGNRSWSGLILVGEHLISNGNNQVSGATLTGLDAMLEDDPEEWIQELGKNNVGNGNKSFVYNSCTLDVALESFGGFAVIENAWMDNWPEY